LSGEQYNEPYGEETPMPQVPIQISLGNFANLENTLMAFIQKTKAYMEDYQSTLKNREASVRDLETQLT
jgi:hypothetical protein